MRLSRFLITDNPSTGLVIDLGGTASLSEGELSGHALGIEVKVDPYELSTLEDRVVLRRNEASLRRSAAP